MRSGVRPVIALGLMAAFLNVIIAATDSEG